MIHIIQNTKDPSGYWINGKYILIENWEIQYNNFSAAEQTEFESKILINH